MASEGLVKKSFARLVLVLRFECLRFGLGIAIHLVAASVGGLGKLYSFGLWEGAVRQHGMPAGARHRLRDGDPFEWIKTSKLPALAFADTDCRKPRMEPEPLLARRSGP